MRSEGHRCTRGVAKCSMNGFNQSKLHFPTTLSLLGGAINRSWLYLVSAEPAYKRYICSHLCLASPLNTCRISATNCQIPSANSIDLLASKVCRRHRALVRKMETLAAGQQKFSHCSKIDG